jgi:ElaA protein
MDIIFECKHFNTLTINELYAIMALRQEVFAVEQNCAYQDADGKDLDSWHLLGRNTEGVLVAYTRLIPKDIAYAKYASIGRVATAPQARGLGLGKLLVLESIKKIKELFPNEAVKIGAQSYLLRFYADLGFESTGEHYIEDNIPHTYMILKK